MNRPYGPILRLSNTNLDANLFITNTRMEKEPFIRVVVGFGMQWTSWSDPNNDICEETYS